MSEGVTFRKHTSNTLGNNIIGNGCLNSILDLLTKGRITNFSFQIVDILLKLLCIVIHVGCNNTLQETASTKWLCQEQIQDTLDHGKWVGKLQKLSNSTIRHEHVGTLEIGNVFS